VNFIQQLKYRNPILFWFGLFNFLVGIICLLLIQVDTIQILGVSRWLKPMKFYFSVGLMIITMGWLLYYLQNPRSQKSFSLRLTIYMFFENGLILLQAIRGTTSHFNISTRTDTIIFNLMGVFILLFTVTCIRVCIAFFRQKEFNIKMPYVWGIRLGLLFFILFSIEGGMMLTLMKHTVGGPDGSPGIPILNWSKEYGDLRIAHFFGLHSLQILPLAGYYLSKTKKDIWIISASWLLLAVFLFIKSLNKSPLFF
jgi:hypothetical protein